MIRTIENPLAKNEKPRLRLFAKNLGMRAVGRVAVGLSGALGSRAGDRVGIVTYHRVSPHVDGLPAPLHNVIPSGFAEQLEGLLVRGFRPIALRDLLAAHRQGTSLPGRSFVVTFDDGFESVYTNAWPVLKRLEIPATVFVNTAYLDSDRPFPFDAWGTAYESHAPPESFRPLRLSQCREMLADGLVEIGAHTHTHTDLRSRPAEFRADLQESVDLLRSYFGHHEISFAFPWGSPHLGFAAGDLESAARQVDVVCGLTTECALVEPHSDPFRWGRFNAFSWDTGATLAAKLNGWYGWGPKARQWIARQISSHVRTSAEQQQATQRMSG